MVTFSVGSHFFEWNFASLIYSKLHPLTLTVNVNLQTLWLVSQPTLYHPTAWYFSRLRYKFLISQKKIANVKCYTNWVAFFLGHYFPLSRPFILRLWHVERVVNDTPHSTSASKGRRVACNFYLQLHGKAIFILLVVKSFKCRPALNQ